MGHGAPNERRAVQCLVVLPEAEISNQLIDALKRVYLLREALDEFEKESKMGEN